MSEKLERLLAQHKDNWKQLALDLEGLRGEAVAGRSDLEDAREREARVYNDYVADLIGTDSAATEDLMRTVVAIVTERSGVLDFWSKPIEVKNLRGDIDTELLLAPIPEVREAHERLAVEIMKLARTRAGGSGI